MNKGADYHMDRNNFESPFDCMASVNANMPQDCKNKINDIFPGLSYSNIQALNLWKMWELCSESVLLL